MTSYNLIIIGAGPGGYETACEAAAAGLSVAIISEGPLGGTCLNEGCIPTKAFCKSAEDYSFFSMVAQMNPQEFFHGAAGRKRDIVDQLRSGISALMSHENITLISGRAALADISSKKKVVAVYGSDGEPLCENLQSENVIIATGSVNAVLPIPGAELCISSREVLDFDRVPASMTVIGGGVIGLELAGILNSFGCKVTVIEFCPEILPRFDSEIAKRLRTSLKKSGIEFALNAKVTGVEASSNGAKVVTYINKKGAEETVESAEVLMAVGRRPNLNSLDFSGIETTPKGVVVDAHQKTSVDGIYAVGDICGGMMLAHTATFQGKIALDDILSKRNPEHVRRNINLAITPAAVFTDPLLASVGKAEQELEPGTYTVHKSFYRSNGKALCIGESDGICKIMTDNATDAILGACIMGASADLLIQQVADVMTLGGKYADLKSIVHAHPTLSEILIG